LAGERISELRLLRRCTERTPAAGFNVRSSAVRSQAFAHAFRFHADRRTCHIPYPLFADRSSLRVSYPLALRYGPIIHLKASKLPISTGYRKSCEFGRSIFSASAVIRRWTSPTPAVVQCRQTYYGD